LIGISQEKPVQDKNVNLTLFIVGHCLSLEKFMIQIEIKTQKR